MKNSGAGGISPRFVSSHARRDPTISTRLAVADARLRAAPTFVAGAAFKAAVDPKAAKRKAEKAAAPKAKPAAKKAVAKKK